MFRFSLLAAITVVSLLHCAPRDACLHHSDCEDDARCIEERCTNENGGAGGGSAVALGGAGGSGGSGGSGGAGGSAGARSGGSAGESAGAGGASAGNASAS